MLSIHFDTSMLVYQGTFLLSGASDQTIVRGSGRARIEFDHQAIMSEDSLIGYAVFDVFPMYSPCTTVTFDSITVQNGYGTTCASTNSEFTAQICSSIRCGTPTFSEFIRYGNVPTLSIVPNPASEVSTVQSNVDLGQVQIELYDVLGNLVMSTSDIISPNHPTSLNLLRLPAGLLSIHVQAAGIGLSQRLMHLR
jgi:hypothetical protein